MDENHISTFTDVKPARTLCQLRAFGHGEVLLFMSYAGPLFTIASAMVIYVSDIPWARVRFGPVPLTSC